MSYKIIWTEEKKEQAIAILTEYFSKHGVGECIQQSDDAIISAPDMLARIADDVLVEGDGITYGED
jgi:hypothetical protein